MDNATIAARIGIRPSLVTALAGRAERPHRKLTDEQIADMIERRERGWGYERLAQRYNVSPGAIHYQCLKHGAVSPKQRQRPVPTSSGERQLRDGRVQRLFTVEDDRQLLELERQGLTYNAIARQVGRAYTSVRIRLMTLALREDIPA
jgi:Zn-dependent peptidase ImmA (M78 family)